jgi:hypothetical protein
MAIKIPSLNSGIKIPSVSSGVSVPSMSQKTPSVSEILKSQGNGGMSYGSPNISTPAPVVAPVVNKPVVTPTAPVVAAKPVVKTTPKTVTNLQYYSPDGKQNFTVAQGSDDENELLANKYTTTKPKTPVEIAAEADAATKAKAELANTNNTTSASNITASSSNFQSLIDKLTKSIDDMSKSKPTSATEYLSQYATDLEQRRKETEQNINAEFDSTKQRTETAQGRETGQFGATLNRIGGYLGGSASSSGAMNALNSDQRFELQTLEAKRQSALTAARSAYDDKSFAVAKAKADEAKSYEQEIYKRQNDFLDNTMQLLTGAQSFRSSQVGTADKMLENITSTDLISPTTRAEIDAVYGNGFTDKYAAYKQVASQAESSKKATESYKAYVDLIQSIPTGQTVSMPDGAKVTGMGKSSDLDVFKTENANGQVTITTFNKMTNKLQNFGAGAIGVPSKEGQKAQTMTVAIPKAQEIIKGFIDPATGYIGDIQKPDGTMKTGAQRYNEMSQAFLQDYPQLGIETFQATFPIETFVSPTQRNAFLKGSGLPTNPVSVKKTETEK